MTRVGRSRKYF